jgi:hypothetical protein
VSVTAHCATCGREVLLEQLTEPALGFRCPFCGTPLAPAYATVAPGVAARALAARQALLGALTELHSMTGERLRIDRGSLLDPIAEATGTTADRV